MSEFLTQEQINALLEENSTGNLDLSGLSQGDGESAGSQGPDYHATEAFVSLFCDHASKVLSMVLNQQTTLGIEQMEGVTAQSLQTGVPGPLLSLECTLTQGMTGTFTCLIGQKTAAILADLMMMGDGKAAYVDEHRDAVVELFNQIMGSFVVALGERCSKNVGNEGVKASEYDPLQNAAAEESVCAQLRVSVGEGAGNPMGIVLSSPVGAQVKELFSEKQNLEGGSPQGSGASDNNGFTFPDQQMNFDTPAGEPLYQKAVNLEQSAGMSKDNVSMILDIELDVSIELGRTDLSIKRILELAPGSIVELDRLAGEPVDLLVNQKVVAKGEVVVVDENFGIRIVSLVSPEERIRSLR